MPSPMASLLMTLLMTLLSTIPFPFHIRKRGEMGGGWFWFCGFSLRSNSMSTQCHNLTYHSMRIRIRTHNSKQLLSFCFFFCCCIF